MIKAISALRLAVADVARSVDFYKRLGFIEVPGGGPSREVRSNWFRIRLEPRRAQRGSSGVRICISVDDVETYAKHLASIGVEMSRETEGKTDELVVTDPDGYTLLFFATKGAAQSGEAAHRTRS